MKKDEVRNTKDEVSVEVLPARVDFSEVRLTNIGTPEERVRWHLSQSYSFGRMSLAHYLLAGWELRCQKARMGWGGWREWCAANLGFSYKTADNYISFFEATVGEARRAVGLAPENEVTDSELDAATVGMDGKTVYQAMAELKIVKRNGDWGGDRRDKAAKNGHTVGRKPKNSPEEVAKELEAAANSEALLWSAAGGAIDTLSKLDAEKDFLRRLADEHLADAAKSLSVLSKKAGEILAGRLARRDMGLHGEAMETAEVVKVLERGL